MTLNDCEVGKACLNQSQNLLAEFLSALGTGDRVKEFLPAEVLHLAEDFLDGPPIGDGLLQPLILFLG